jgi:hypothetical protein
MHQKNVNRSQMKKNKGKVKIVKKNTARKPHVCKCKKNVRKCDWQIAILQIKGI